MLYSDDSAAVSKATATPDMGVGPYQLLSQVINKVFDKGDPLPVGKGEAKRVSISRSRTPVCSDSSPTARRASRTAAW